MERIVDFRGIGVTLVHLAKTKPPFLWPKAIRVLHANEDVVRCRDCKRIFDSYDPNKEFCVLNQRFVEKDGFCAWGEPR